MIQIEKLDRIPRLEWSEHTNRQAEEVFKVEASIMRRSKEVYLVSGEDGPLMIVGLIQGSLISGWHLWCMVCKCDLRKHVRSLRLMLHTLVKKLGHLMVTVEKSFNAGIRFAKFMNFRLTSEVDSIDHKTYCFFSMDRAWLTQ